MAFPQTPLDVRTELRVGTTWTDISADVYTRSPITITRGVPDEGTTADPSSCALMLNNRSGTYSPKNPLSPYYGLIGRNTPIRVSVPGPESYLSLDGTLSGLASTPDVAAIDITGDIDLRVEVTADWSQPGIQGLLGKWVSATAQRSYNLRLENGYLVLNWSPDGTSIYLWQWFLPALPRRAAVRATLDVDNGAGGHTAIGYWAPSLSGPWTAMDTRIGAFVTSVYASTAPLQITPVAAPGWTPPQALIHRAEVRNGIGGTVVAAPDFRALAEGTTAFSDSAGRAWSVTGTARVSNRAYRFVGEVASWPARWDVSGKDVYVPIEAAGILRRLGQGRKPLDSTLRRSIPRAASLLAYWPMEEGALATAASSPVTGVQPLQLSRATWASATTLASSAPLPVLASAGGDLAQMTGAVPAPGGSPTGWRVQWVYRLDTPNATMYTFMRILTAGGTIAEWYIQQSSTGSRIIGRDAGGTDIITQLIGTGLDLYNQWNSVWFQVEQVGATVQWDIYWQDVGGAAGHFGSSFTGTIGRVRTVGGPPGGYAAALDGMAIGHLSVFSTPTTTAYDGALTAYDTEYASNRLARLSAESGGLLPMTFTIGAPGVAQQMLGPQHAAELLDLVGDVAATDGGLLFERRDRSALHYRDRASLYNQTPGLVLNYTTTGHVAPPLEPAEDDQRLRNDVTVTRDGGSSGRVEITSGPLSTLPPEQGGVGTYDTEVTLSLGSDDQAQQIAGWLAHLGTADEPRYPAVHVMLHAAPALTSSVLGLELGDLLRIDNLPAWLPPEPALLMVRGQTEVLDLYSWDVTFNCGPGRAWSVGVYDDAVRGRYDTSGSQLAAAATATAPSLSVAFTDGTRWVTTASHPASFPFDALVGGERVTVTGITGTTSPQTWTVTRSVNGIAKAQAAGTDVRLADPTYYAL
ncbi:hypothetical protein ACFYPN_33585 [Streptomyces sp. NPDC005576]|uniref:hypothetical protein n=1 Tax=Streptomyces sp. NPDC005576 TaxID=3364726 RepID=UPI0036888739